MLRTKIVYLRGSCMHKSDIRQSIYGDRGWGNYTNECNYPLSQGQKLKRVIITT